MKVVMHLIFHEHKQTVKSRLINFQIKQSYKITALTHLQLFGLNSRNLTNCQVLVPNTPNPNPGDGSGADTKITRLQADQWINGAVIVFNRRPRRLGERVYGSWHDSRGVRAGSHNLTCGQGDISDGDMDIFMVQSQTMNGEWRY